jgi:hypothetical protein
MDDEGEQWNEQKMLGSLSRCPQVFLADKHFTGI